MFEGCARLPGLLLPLLLLASPGSARAAASGGGGALPGAPGERFVQPGVVVVKLLEHPGSARGPAKTGALTVDRFMLGHGLIAVEPLLPNLRPPRQAGGVDLSRVFLVRYADGEAPDAVAAALSRLDAVEYAEPLYAYPLAVQPNDTNVNLQLSYLLRMQFLAGWDVTQGGQGDVVVAIVDGGTDWTHNDLSANLWSNPGEIVNGLDDDDNGLVDDIRGWNFANNTNDPRGLPSTPESAAHGTHTAGIACAVTNNALQVAGASWNAKFMPINTALASEDRVIAWGYSGIAYAAANGADVISLSWGGRGSPSTFEREVIQFAHDAGAAICAAAGNEGINADDHYPSAFPQVLSVTNVDISDVKLSNANYGISVDVAAQGQDIVSTFPNNSTAYLTGTSMSTPFVAAACALVKTRWPGYTADQVMQRVRVTSDNIDAINFQYPGLVGYGRLNVLRALTMNTPAIRIAQVDIADQDGDGIVEHGETVAVGITVTNFLARAQNVTFTLSETSQFVTISNPQVPVGSIDSLQSLQLPSFNLQIDPQAANNHVVSLTLGVTTGVPAYTDVDRFTLTIQPLFLDHARNQIHTTITSMGRLGYALMRGDGTDGIGFAHGSGPNVLFEAAMMMGYSASKLVDAARGLKVGGQLTYQSNFGTPAGGTPQYLPPLLADEQSLAYFSDGAAPSSLRILLNMRQDAYLFANSPDDDYIILRYRIRNDSGGNITGLRVGWYQDWDIGDATDAEAALGDLSGYDAGRGLGYAWDEAGGGNGVHVGTVVLTPPGTTTFRGIWNDETNPNNPSFGVYDGYSKSEKWQTLSEGIVHTEVGPQDISLAIATGPFTIPANDSVVVAFAYVAGDNLADLQANTDAAIAKWATLGPLTPVVLYDLTATQEGSTVVVRWRAGDERDIAAYRVYRSHDGGPLEALGPDVERNVEGSYAYRDAAPPAGRSLYRVGEVSPAGDVVLHGSVEIEVASSSPPRSYLSAGIPNPFNPSTTFRYGLTTAGPVRLTAYDARGRHVRTLQQNAYVAAGTYTATWNGLDDSGRAVPSGSYHIRLQLADQMFTRRVTLLK